jgi:hypothetical protein
MRRSSRRNNPVKVRPKQFTGANDHVASRDLHRDYAWVVDFTPGAESEFRIMDVVLNPATKMLTLTWNSRPNHTYAISGSSALAF